MDLTLLESKFLDYKKALESASEMNLSSEVLELATDSYQEMCKYLERLHNKLLNDIKLVCSGNVEDSPYCGDSVRKQTVASRLTSSLRLVRKPRKLFIAGSGQTPSALSPNMAKSTDDVSNRPSNYSTDQDKATVATNPDLDEEIMLISSAAHVWNQGHDDVKNKEWGLTSEELESMRKAEKVVPDPPHVCIKFQDLIGKQENPLCSSRERSDRKFLGSDSFVRDIWRRSGLCTDSSVRDDLGTDSSVRDIWRRNGLGTDSSVRDDLGADSTVRDSSSKKDSLMDNSCDNSLPSPICKEVHPKTAISVFLDKGASNGVLRAVLKTTLGGPALGLKFPIGVCDYNGGLAVCNSGDDTVVYFKFDSDQLFQKKILTGFHRPSAVAVDGNNFLFVKDDFLITKYDSELKKQVTNFSLTKLKKPYGLVVTKDNNLITLCNGGNGRFIPRDPTLLVFNTEGDLLSKVVMTLPLLANSKLRFMALHQDNIYISDLGASQVLCVDLTSGKLNKIIAGSGKSPGSFTEPSGIVVDSDGNILIADSRANRIQVFGKDGTYQAMLECSDTLVRPSGIYLSSENLLYIVNYIAHKVSVYTLDK